MSQTISQLPAADAVSGTDQIALTQASIGPGSGTTRVAKISQIGSIIASDFAVQSVANKTGQVTLEATDVINFNTAVSQIALVLNDTGTQSVEGTVQHTGFLQALSGVDTSRTVTWTGGTNYYNANPTQAGISGGQSFSGTISGSSNGGSPLNGLLVVDYLNAAAVGGAIGFNIQHNLNGTSVTGPRSSLQTTLQVQAPTGNVSTSQEYSGLEAYCIASGNDNGTSGSAKGVVFGINTVAQLGSTCTWWDGCVGYELDVGVVAGANVNSVFGLHIATFGNHAVNGSLDDIALHISGSTGQTAFWETGLGFGANTKPTAFGPSSTLIKAYPNVLTGTLTVANFIDLTPATVTVTGNVWKSQGATITGLGDGTFKSLSQTVEINIASYLPAANGTTDDTSKFAAALTALSTSGGGRLIIGPYQYAVSNLTIPSNVVLCGNFFPGGQVSSGNYTTQPFTLVVSGTITLSSGAGIRGVCLQSSGVFAHGPSTNMRTMVTLLAAYSGTAITIAGNDTWCENLFILGFAQAWKLTGYARPHVNNIIGDNLAGIYINQCGDTARITNIHWWNYLTGGQSWTVTTYSVSALANNGSGLIRVTTTAAHALVTGDVVNIAGCGGLVQANNRWTVTVIDTTHFDLQGSSFVGATPTGNVTSGSNQITALSSLSGVVIGQPVSGTGIPGGATVASVNDGTNAVTFSGSAATATGATETITFTAGTYTSGGTVYVRAGWARPGPAWLCGNAAYMIFENLGSFGYDIGFRMTTVTSGQGAGWTTITNIGMDHEGSAYDPQTVGILFDGNSFAGSINGGFVGPYGEQVRVNSGFTSYSNSGSAALKITGVSFNASTGGYYSIGVLSGSLVLTGDAFRGNYIYVADQANGLYISGCETGNPVNTGGTGAAPFYSFLWQSPADQLFVSIDGVISYTQSPSVGTWALGNTVKNSVPSQQGTAGSEYIVTGWACTAAGTPGTWYPLRSLTGN